MIDPAQDGITHINVYSKGATSLGRFLSNFADAPAETPDGLFRTIEGYWYWLGCGDDRLRTTRGWESKQLGRALRAPDWQHSDEFKLKICAAITTKLETYPDMYDELVGNCLPLRHYYTYKDKVVEPKEGGWILYHISCMGIPF
jgi:hypothetical protein